MAIDTIFCVESLRRMTTVTQLWVGNILGRIEEQTYI